VRWALRRNHDQAGKKLVVVDFFATWCGPCKQIAPKFAELSGQNPKTVFLKVDVDLAKDLAQQYEVRAHETKKKPRRVAPEAC
jgi:thioredoxin 1